MNNNKVYILIQENYNILANENGASYIIGVYKNKNDAIKDLRKEINDDINNYDWVLDEIDDIKKFNVDNYGKIRLFYKYQDNWDFYYEISIQEQGLK